MQISARGRNIQASPIRRYGPCADKAKEKGIHIYHLNIGNPDVPTPGPVMEAFHNYNESVMKYGPAQGLAELRQAVARYFNGFGIPIETDHVIITIGGSEAIHFSLAAVADPGDEVIIPEPYYTNFNGFASLAAVKIVPIPLKVEDGYRLPPRKEIEERITPRTKAIILCSPSNPTGTVYSAEELSRVVDIVKKYDLFLISDEVYKEYVYDGLTAKSVLEFDEIKDRAIIVDSVSKRFSCCGARVGAVISRNPEVLQTVLKFAQARLCPPTVEQLAAVAAYGMPRDYFEPIRREYQKRRDILYESLKDVPGIVIRKPEGAFFFSVRLPVKDADHFVVWMLSDFELDKKTVMVTPAEGFYCTPGRGRDEVRIAYVLNERELKEAIRVFKAGLEKYGSLYS